MSARCRLHDHIICTSNTRPYTDDGTEDGALFTMGGYQVEGEPAIIETQFGGSCEKTAVDGSSYTSTFDDGKVYFQEYPRYQDVMGNRDTVGTVGEPKAQAFRFALAIHAWLLLVIGARIYQWVGCTTARDYRTGGYVRFCVQLEKSKVNIWIVRLSILTFVGIAGVGFFLSMTGDQRLASQLSNILVLFFAIYKLYSTPDVVVDLDHDSFVGAIFKAQPLWLSGCDGIVTKLGPLVATKNDEKLKADYVTELTAGDMVLIGPPKEEQGGDGLLPSAERP